MTLTENQAGITILFLAVGTVGLLCFVGESIWENRKWLKSPMCRNGIMGCFLLLLAGWGAIFYCVRREISPKQYKFILNNPYSANEAKQIITDKGKITEGEFMGMAQNAKDKEMAARKISEYSTAQKP